MSIALSLISFDSLTHNIVIPKNIINQIKKQKHDLGSSFSKRQRVINQDILGHKFSN